MKWSEESEVTKPVLQCHSADSTTFVFVCWHHNQSGVEQNFILGLFITSFWVNHDVTTHFPLLKLFSSVAKFCCCFFPPETKYLRKEVIKYINVDQISTKLHFPSYWFTQLLSYLDQSLQAMNLRILEQMLEELSGAFWEYTTLKIQAQDWNGIFFFTHKTFTIML